MTAVLKLVQDGGFNEMPPLDAWEIHMRGAGRSERTIRDGRLRIEHMERFTGKTVATMTPLDGSRPVEWCKSGRVSACGSVVATMP
ncbi:hypothetical protein BB736_001985 [Mycobacterium avium subsp. hominissuis]|uniref:hypothetical protein n=1 Tax=Mycobacterium avium TaxID=1764 RepID=UPI003C300A5C